MVKKLSILFVIALSLILLTACGNTYQDGTFEGRSAEDERGAYGLVSLVIENDRILEADFQEIMNDGQPKNEETYPNWTPTLDAIDLLPQELVEKQNIDQVDNFAEATGTTEKFKEAVRDALEQAQR